MLRPDRTRTGLPTSHVIAWVLVVLALLPRWGFISWDGWDLDVYLDGGRALLDGSQLYGVPMSHGLFFTYPPFGAALFTVPALLGTTASYVLSIALSLALYVGCMLLVCRRLGTDRRLTALLVVAGLTLEPVVRTLAMGQINLLLAALVVVDCLAPRMRWRGFLVGVAAGIKIVPGAFVLYFLLRRDWASAGRAALGGLVTVLLGFAVAPQASWSYWTGGFLAMGKFGDDAGPRGDNQSLSAVILRVLHEPGMSGAAALAVAGLCMGAAAWVAHRQLRAGDPAAAVLALGLGSVLGSPVSWSHHWVWLAFALPVLLRRGLHPFAWVVGVVGFTALHWSVETGGLAELDFSLGQQLAVGSFPLTGVALLVVLGLTTRRLTAPADAPSDTTADDTTDDAGTTSGGTGGAGDRVVQSVPVG